MNDIGTAVWDRATDATRQAVRLVDRLLHVEARVLGLERQNATLRQAGASGPVAGSTLGAEAPGPKYEWVLADRPTTTPADLGPYDIRPDDDVVMEGRAGEEFLAAFGLLGDTPDFRGAVQFLNGAEKQLRSEDVPDASIIIPVYGQLAYSLNCIHSLFAHASRYSAEIIFIDDVSPDDTGLLLPEIGGIRYHRQPRNGGFIVSCNTGAAMARGKFMIMLNNDTRVVPGWLDELISSFALWPQAGLVGSKMHYADGSLQEAGGIIWRDGRGWNYGRNDDPNRPQYCYARQVDYISGCSIAVPADLWRELGGFDDRYRPAYCEDADMALRVRAMGRQVWFQPRSRIVHYEGKTGGTDTGKGTKAYQVTNEKKLFLKWRESLAHHRRNAEAPLFERERDVKQRILVVDVTAPTPDQDAGSVQTVIGLRVCQMLGYKAHFVPEDNWLFQPKYLPPLQREGVECAYAPYELGFENYIRKHGWMFDIVLVYRVSVVDRVLDLVRTHAPQAVFLFHVADLHYLRMERTARLNADAELLEAARLMKQRELGLMAQVDCTITHSEYERDLLAEEAPGAPVTVWPLMFDFFGTEQSFEARRDVVFLGGYRHPPNVDAVLYFAQEILPRLLVKEPTLRFIIAGANPPDEVLALAGPNIVVTGLVDDLRTVFDAARVFVCPLRVGAGTKGKIISALSYGIPIVSTPTGVEGTSLRDDVEVLVADDPASFAAATLRLYYDAALWKRLSQSGQAVVRDTLSAGMGVKALGEAIEKGLARKLGVAV